MFLGSGAVVEFHPLQKLRISSQCFLERHLSTVILSLIVITMDAKSKSYLAIAMGIIILLADIYWLVVGSSYTYPPWLAAGIIIFIADLIWLWVDYDLMKK
jgi:hypothetical protein